MAHAFGTKTTVAKVPEVDEMEGYSFVAFEKLHEMDNYVRRTACRRHQHRVTLSHRLQSGNVAKKARKFNPTATAAATLPHRKLSKTAKPNSSNPSKKSNAAEKPKKSIFARHRQRLRKSDKKAIGEKMYGFVFVSGFTLQDLDDYDPEVGNSTDAATKRKAETALAPPNATKKPRKKVTHGLKVDDRARLGPSKPCLGGGPTTDLHTQLQTPMSPLKKFGLNRVKKLNKSVLKTEFTPSKSQSAAHPRVNRGRKIPAASSTKKEQHYPRMQIDGSDHGGTVSVSSSSDSDTLDVCGIDDIPSSTQFIESNILQVKPWVSDSKPAPDKNDTARPKNKKKKCKTCCAHPCKIVEAKKVNYLWGSTFPSYNVSCVSTCTVHLPGEISAYPNETRFGYVDTCIQTTASDIEMHLKFAERFPHHAIAVESHGSVPDDTSMVKSASHLRVNTTKIENHRTSEQKRREQLHESFVGLRKVVCVSQAVLDNERASKQWILEQAQKVIASLKSESVLLTAMKESLVAKNQKLKKRWTELTGKKFDPGVTREQTKEPSHSKLMSLYKKYRQDVQKEKPMDNMVPGLPKVVSGEQNKHSSGNGSRNESVKQLSHGASIERSENESNILSLSNSSEPIVISEGEEDLPADNVENHLKEWSKVSQASVNLNNPSEVINKESQSILVDMPSLTVNKFSEAAITKKPSGFASVVKWDHDISYMNVNRPLKSNAGQAVSPNVNKPSVFTVDRPGQTHTVNKPRQAVVPVVKNMYPLILPSPPGNNSNQKSPPSNNPGHATAHPITNLTQPDTLKKPLPVVMRLSNTNTKIPNSIASLSVVNKILTLNKARHVPSESSIPLGKPGNIFVLNNQSQVVIGTPTQWMSLGKVVPSVFHNMMPSVEDVGAVVEVGETKCDTNQKECDKIVLLDVAETEKKTPESTVSEQARTVSFIPSSSSINVTLKSVGSITSNKMFNKKPPLTSTESSFPNILYQPSKTISTSITTPGTSAPIQGVEDKNLICANMVSGQVPEISDALLSDIDSTNELGLCVISNVFSLSKDKFEKSSSESHQENPFVTNNLSIEQSSAECENQDSPPMHDHNYYKMNLQSNETCIN